MSQGSSVSGVCADQLSVCLVRKLQENMAVTHVLPVSYRYDLCHHYYYYECKAALNIVVSATAFWDIHCMCFCFHQQLGIPL